MVLIEGGELLGASERTRTWPVFAELRFQLGWEPPAMAARRHLAPILHRAAPEHIQRTCNRSGSVRSENPPRTPDLLA